MRLLPLLLIPAIAISLSGCTDSAGPLVTQKGDKSCADSALYSDLVFGLYIKNAGPHPVTLTSLTFGSLSHVTVRDAWVVPNDAQGGVGIQKYPLTSSAWAEREQIPGASVPPNTESNIAVRLDLKSGAKAGIATDATVEYTDADRQSYVVTSAAVIGFGPDATCG